MSIGISYNNNKCKSVNQNETSSRLLLSKISERKVLDFSDVLLFVFLFHMYFVNYTNTLLVSTIKIITIHGYYLSLSYSYIVCNIRHSAKVEAKYSE